MNTICHSTFDPIKPHMCPSKDHDESLIGLFNSKFNHTTEEQASISFDSFDAVMMAPNQCNLPADTLSVLNGIDAELLCIPPNENMPSSKSERAGDPLSFDGFVPSDFEPIPIKLDPYKREDNYTLSSQEIILYGLLQEPQVEKADLVTDPIRKRGFGSMTNVVSDIDLASRPTKQARSTGCPSQTFKKPAFRPYQEKQWEEQFEALQQFKKDHGHCRVPHTFQENQALSRWVKRQRYQYKMKKNNKESTMTQVRIERLEELGFVWDSHKLAWQDRLKELEEYKVVHGDCNVPSTFLGNPALATWVKCQRRQYRRFRSGDFASMPLDRIAALDAIGFNWNRR